MNGSSFKDLCATLEDLIDIVDVLRVGLDGEVHESDFKFKESGDFNGFALLFNDLVGVLLEQFEDV